MRFIFRTPKDMSKVSEEQRDSISLGNAEAIGPDGAVPSDTDKLSQGGEECAPRNLAPTERTETPPGAEEMKLVRNAENIRSSIRSTHLVFVRIMAKWYTDHDVAELESFDRFLAWVAARHVPHVVEGSVRVHMFNTEDDERFNKQYNKEDSVPVTLIFVNGALVSTCYGCLVGQIMDESLPPAHEKLSQLQLLQHSFVLSQEC